MRINEFKKASFASRLVTLFAVVLMFIFSALVILDNNELKKILPHSPARSLALFFGYCFAILSTNYLMALRGRNLIDWKSEILISINFMLFFSAWTLPWLFPIILESRGPWWKLFQKITQLQQNPIFYFVFLIQLPILIYTIIRLRRFFRSNASDTAH